MSWMKPPKGKMAQYQWWHATCPQNSKEANPFSTLLQPVKGFAW